MRYRQARHLKLAAIAMAAATVFPLANNSFAATAKTTVTNGAIKLIVYGDGEGAGSNVVFTGAIGDGGYADSIDANGALDPQNNTAVHMALSQGTFNIDITPINRALEKAFNGFRPNVKTCSAEVSVSNQTVKIIRGSGTGAYSGIIGHITVTLSFANVGVKYTSGKHKGQCNNSQDSPPSFSAMMVAGTGTVSY